MQLDARSSSPSLMRRLRSSICSSCCFGGAAGEEEDDARPASTLIRSSTVWLQSRPQELPEIGGRCRNLLSRIGRHHHSRRGSGDFAYDPLSYALNFDDGLDHDDLPASSVDGYRYRSFASRLPPSPPRPAAASAVEVVF